LQFLRACGRPENPFVGFARGGIVVPIEKLRIDSQRFDAAALRGSFEEFVRARGIALAFHLPGTQIQVLGCRCQGSSKKKNEGTYEGFHAGLPSLPAG
jgi:hypothetical protein